MSDPPQANSAAAAPPAAKRGGFGLRFSLRTLLLLMVLVGVYLGGRASVNLRHALPPRLDGEWEARLPRGFVQKSSLQHLGDGQFLLRSRAAVFNGKYQWRNGVLAVVEPTDERMVGLEWKWDGKQLTLVNEPKNTPNGASYVGTVLVRPQPPAK
jgi:hypothetical protein